MRSIGRGVHQLLLSSATWPEVLHERAVANARAASTECSRRRVEREEVALFLATSVTSPAAVRRHPA